MTFRRHDAASEAACTSVPTYTNRQTVMTRISGQFIGQSIIAVMQSLYDIKFIYFISDGPGVIGILFFINADVINTNKFGGEMFHKKSLFKQKRKMASISQWGRPLISYFFKFLFYAISDGNYTTTIKTKT